MGTFEDPIEGPDPVGDILGGLFYIVTFGAFSEAESEIKNGEMKAKNADVAMR